MKSMTGFGSAQESNHLGELSIEIKSYNSRYLDLSIHLPHQLLSLEPVVRKEVLALTSRGKVEVTVKWFASSQEKLNLDAVSQFKAMLMQLKTEGIEPGYQLADLKEWAIFSKSRENVLPEEFFMAVLTKAMDQFILFRSQEGINLAHDLSSQLAVMGDAVNKIEQLAPEADQLVVSRLQSKFKQIVGVEFEERRVLEEIATYLVKININEEIIRMKSHLSAFTLLLKDEEPVGKRIDFLSQELNREVNTMGSKTPLIAIQQLNIILKEAIEKVREQARNVE